MKNIIHRKVREAIHAYDFSSVLEDAIDEIDFNEMVSDAIESYDFSYLIESNLKDYIREEIEEALDNLEFDDLTDEVPW